MIPFYSIALVVFLLDLFTKIMVRQWLPLGHEIRILPFFSLVHVQNTGVAFGLFQEKNFFFLILGVLMIGFIVLMGWKMARESRLEMMGLGFILGGAVGNITDRVFYGCVTDFLDFFVGLYHWPAFNVADSAICVGAALMIMGALKPKRT